MTQPPILSVAADLETPTVKSLAEHHSVSELMDCDNPLIPLIKVLEILGPKVFDDEAQWHGYRDIIAGMALIDNHPEFDTSDVFPLAEYPPASFNQYHPLAEAGEADVGPDVIPYLVNRYKVDEFPEFKDYPASTPTSREAIQGSLGRAILNLSMGHFPERKYVEKLILLSMSLVDRPFDTNTEIEYELTTQTFTVGEGDDEETHEYESPGITVYIPTSPSEAA